MYLNDPDNVSQIKIFDHQYLTDIWSKEVMNLFAELNIKSVAKADKATRTEFSEKLEARLSEKLFVNEKERL